ncbi:MAG: asparagine synthase (glutamine-hydrolyzing) [Methylococcaceae bacterium]
MCGIAGFLLNPTASDRNHVDDTIAKMTETLTHRGPDDSGVWVNRTAGIALGHRRLSVIETSELGHQPMLSTCERYVIVFNGEIYNHQELRRELEYTGYLAGWKGQSDTETLLAMIATRGVSATLRKLQGMFTFALWDQNNQHLILARDRMGEKPLYYGWIDDVFVFASELKALKAYPGFKGEVDRRVLSLYLRMGYVPAPWTIYQGLSKLSPAHCITLICGRKDVASENYWTAISATRKGQREKFAGTDGEAINALDEVLRRSVNDQLIADVPLGAFLSGGIDSSLIVAIMKSLSGETIKTFSIGFKESGYDEAPYARNVAAHLGTEHSELYVTPKQALEVLPLLPVHYDEPFADPSALPTFLLARLAREQVTVSLSGDGGDELFGGYNRYLWTAQIWKRFGTWSPGFRVFLSTLMMLIPPSLWDQLLNALVFMLPPTWRLPQPGDKVHKMANMLPARSPVAMYHSLVSHWKLPTELVINGKEPPTLLDSGSPPREIKSLEQYLMYLDVMTYLPDNILVKLDRAAMANSLETRVPFLDYRLYEFSQTLPLEMKIRDGQGKWILRELLYRYIPRNLIERPKTGFAVPLDSWLRGPMKKWAQELLAEKRLAQEGYLNPALIQIALKEHLSGRRNNAQALWIILMFQSWLENNQKPS